MRIFSRSAFPLNTVRLNAMLMWSARACQLHLQLEEVTQESVGPRQATDEKAPTAMSPQLPDATGGDLQSFNNQPTLVMR